MKLHILNDLHLEHFPMAPPETVGDVLVLAGDIADGGKAKALLEITSKYRAANKPVIYVPGNHEFYGRRMDEALLELWRASRKHGIEMLHNRCVVIDGVRFFGSTLWTDYCLERAARQKESMAMAKVYLADHTWIFLKDRKHPQGKRTFAPEDALAAHRKGLRLMRNRLAQPFDGPTVVVTHHAPSPKSIHPRFGAHAANAAFVSNLENVVAELKPTLWVHGHTHDGFDYRLGSTRVVANPRGYPRSRHAEEPEFENRGFNEDFYIEI
jgi:Icc-related predicted phosphoesterase